MNLVTAFEALKMQVEAYAKPAMDIKVAHKNDLEDAMLVVREIENLKKSVEVKRKEIVSPLNDSVKEVNTYAKDLVAPLTTASEHIRGELIKWEQKLERDRKEAAALLQREKDAAELFGTDFTEQLPLIAKEKEIKANRVSGTRKEWGFEITDPNLIPREYCTPDPRLIRAAVTIGKREIPGARIFESTKITIRS
jgi:hypothetical protein